MTTPTFEPVELPSRYAKAYVMILTTAIAAVSAALAGGLSLDELVSIGVLVLSTIGVYLVPLGSSGVQRYSKLGIAVLGTAGQAAVPLLMNGGTVDTSGWLLIILAALGAVSVGITPNAPASGRPVTLNPGTVLNVGSDVVVRASFEPKPEALYDPNRERPSGRPASAPDVL